MDVTVADHYQSLGVVVVRGVLMKNGVAGDQAFVVVYVLNMVHVSVLVNEITQNVVVQKALLKITSN